MTSAQLPTERYEHSLVQLVETRMDETALGWRVSTPTGAYGRCIECAEHLFPTLIAAGYDTQYVAMHGRIRRFEHETAAWKQIDPPRYRHYVLAVRLPGNIEYAIDPSFRQFDSKSWSQGIFPLDYTVSGWIKVRQLGYRPDTKRAPYTEIWLRAATGETSPYGEVCNIRPEEYAFMIAQIDSWAGLRGEIDPADYGLDKFMGYVFRNALERALRDLDGWSEEDFSEPISFLQFTQKVQFFV